MPRSRPLGVHVDTVRKWRGRFALQRPEGLRDLPRSGRPTAFTDVQGRALGPDEYVISADEKSPLQALRRRHPDQPAGPGRTRRVEFEYIRGGTLAYFAGYDVHHARIMGRIAPEDRDRPFTELVEQVMTTEPCPSAKRGSLTTAPPTLARPQSTG